MKEYITKKMIEDGLMAKDVTFLFLAKICGKEV